VLGKYGPSAGAPTSPATGGNTGNGVTWARLLPKRRRKVGDYKIEIIARRPASTCTIRTALLSAKARPAWPSRLAALPSPSPRVAHLLWATAARSPWRRMPTAGKYGPLDLAATEWAAERSRDPVQHSDASAGDTKATVITRAAEVNGSELTYPAAATANQIAAINAQLSVLGIRSARHNSQENLGSTSPHPNPLPRWGRGGVS
jgi:hypothetical protein